MRLTSSTKWQIVKIINMGFAPHMVKEAKFLNFSAQVKIPALLPDGPNNEENTKGDCMSRKC